MPIIELMLMKLHQFDMLWKWSAGVGNILI